MVYYNEFDPKAAAWLRELIKAGLIAKGAVDDRSIKDVSPSDLNSYTQCHFFAGIGGWSYALRLAGWPDDRPAWTGSCPCQPFSVAGLGKGTNDDRHLWPGFYRLIRECDPSVCFGEQVASKDALSWIDIVQTDLESSNYAVGSADLCAAGVGAPHIRQRLYWLAESIGKRSRRRHFRHDEGWSQREIQATGSMPVSGLGDSCDEGPQGREGMPERGNQQLVGSPSLANFWSDVEWLYCRDGKYRPTQPSLFPLAHGVPARVGRLRGYGNAIVPQVAAEFVRAYMETKP
jgi:DNA (cytosine-5)-methyltransferase 1